MTNTARDLDRAPVHLVDTDMALQRAVTEISKLDEVALDTEFHSERRYYPELMLLQVSGPTGESWLFDPRAIDVGDIVRVVSTRSVLVHAGQEDLAILKREADTAPHTLLDVQICAGLLGHGYPTRLGVIAQKILGHAMSKQATLSNWSQRPLTEQQIGYAVLDVRILHPLAQRLRSELRARGRLQWAEAATVEMATRSTRPPTAHHRWTDWEIAHQFDEQTRSVLQAIFEWRDARGRDKDQPAHFMLSDGLALDVARRRPVSIEQLHANRRVPGGLVKRFGTEIIRVVAQAQALDLSPIEVPTHETRLRASTLQLWATTMSKTTGIAPQLAMPRQLALKLARSGISALTGWRAEAIGEALHAFLSGEEGLFLDQDTTEVR